MIWTTIADCVVHDSIDTAYQYAYVFPPTQMEVVSKYNKTVTISSGCIELWYHIISVGVGPAKATVWKGFHAVFVL